MKQLKLENVLGTIRIANVSDDNTMDIAEYRRVLTAARATHLIICNYAGYPDLITIMDNGAPVTTINKDR